MPFLGLGVAALLLVANAFFVLVEFAIVKSRVTRLEELTQTGFKNAALAREIVQKTGEYLSACQLGVTMCSLGIGWIGEPAVAALLEPLLLRLPTAHAETIAYSLSFAVAFLSITSLHMILGELVPKYIALQYAERALMLLARPLRVFHGLFYTPLNAINRAASAVVRFAGLAGASAEERIHSEEELRMLISGAEEHGQFPLRRLLLFENLFDFGDQKVRDVMTPRDSVVFLTPGASWEETLAVVGRRKFTRLPLCANTLDAPLGYLHLKDLAMQLANAVPGAKVDLPSLKRELPTVNEELSLEKALTHFQQRHIPIALVNGPGAKTVGLVTLEDILEELVGEIQDEFESPPSGSLLNVFMPQASDLELTATDRVGAISRLLQLVHAAAPGIDYKEAFDILMKRETALTTAIGREVAIPHGRLPNLAAPILAIGRSTAGIPFDAPDKRPVKLLFLILTPASEPRAQLRLLATIAGLVSNRALHRRLKKAKTPSELTEILKAFDQTMPA